MNFSVFAFSSRLFRLAGILPGAALVGLALSTLPAQAQQPVAPSPPPQALQPAPAPAMPSFAPSPAVETDYFTTLKNDRQKAVAALPALAKMLSDHRLFRITCAGINCIGKENKEHEQVLALLIQLGPDAGPIVRELFDFYRFALKNRDHAKAMLALRAFAAMRQAALPVLAEMINIINVAPDATAESLAKLPAREVERMQQAIVVLAGIGADAKPAIQPLLRLARIQTAFFQQPSFQALSSVGPQAPEVIEAYADVLTKAGCCMNAIERTMLDYISRRKEFTEKELQSLASIWRNRSLRTCSQPPVYEPMFLPVLRIFTARPDYATLVTAPLAKTFTCDPAQKPTKGIVELIAESAKLGALAGPVVPALERFVTQTPAYRKEAMEALKALDSKQSRQALENVRVKEEDTKRRQQYR